ncbi:MAG: hypothetical protein HC866_26745 [Leptolyngbyaceae cyanobacterium RU_5_1]|nr:hypothetical protein [Leptolyngbyaceae cyanobacterium RU_5_1]
MSSINGESIIVLVTRDGRFQDQRSLTLRTGVAVFRAIPPGGYTIIARHPDLTPTEARYDAELTEKTILGIRFTYNEPERQLSTIEAEVSYLP